MTDQPNIDALSPDAPVEERLNRLIENISAYIEYYHNGSVRLVEFDGSTAYVRLGGACDGCDRARMTLKGWVEGTVRQFFPDVTVEEAPAKDE